MTDLIPFPGFEELKNEIEQLRTELSMLVLERDDLRLVVCKDLETIYLLNFGALEYRLYKAQCEYLRLKRKAELIQAQINRQERIDLEAVGHKLDAEFAEYKQKLDERIEQMNAALEHGKGELLSAEQTTALKKMYRKIVKALHPDLHPELTDAQKQLFLNAVEAYEKGDATSLEVIAAMVADAGAFVAPDAPDARAAMLKEKKRLGELLQGVKDDIARIKSEFPYTARELLQDPVAVQEKKNELEADISINETGIAAYEQIIKEMLEKHHG